MKALFSLILIISAVGVFAQPKRHYHPELESDFVIVQNEIWLLKKDSTVHIFNAQNGKSILKNLDNNLKACSIGKDNHDNIIVTDKQNNIFKLNKTSLKFELVASCKNKQLFYTFFNSKGNCFLVTNDGIIDPTTNGKWFPAKRKDHFIKQYNDNDWGDGDQVSGFIDRNDNIWVNVHYGEFGSEFFIFNTIKRKFIIPDTRPFFVPILSFCQDKDHVFFSGGSYEAGITKWLQYDDNGEISLRGDVIYDSDRNPKTEMLEFEGIFGFITYRKQDSSLYMSCTEGLYKGRVNTDLSSISKWEKVPKYILAKKDRVSLNYRVSLDEKTGKEIHIPLDEGSPILEGKIEFTANDKLVILGRGNGLFLFDGKKLLKISNR